MFPSSETAADLISGGTSPMLLTLSICVNSVGMLDIEKCLNFSNELPFIKILAMAEYKRVACFTRRR